MQTDSTATDTDDKEQNPSWGVISVLAAQHVIVLFSGIILVPVMLVQIYGFNEDNAHYMIFMTALCAAVATLLQLIRSKRFGLGQPMFMGTSGAFMSCSHAAIAQGGVALLSGLVLITAPFQILFSYMIRYMRHILTPTVGGVIIMLAVVGLLKDSIATWVDPTHLEEIPALTDIAIGSATMAVMLAAEWFGGTKLRPWGLPLGILAGSFIAGIAGTTVIPDLSQEAWLGLPDGEWPGVSFSLGDASHWTMVFTFILAVLATSIKYTGDAMILQKVVEPNRRKVDYDALQGGLYANSVAMLLAGFAGGMPSSSHTANIPVMKMTGVATRRVAVFSSLLLAAVALSPKMLMVLVSLPRPVIGGVGVVLVAHLFSSGMQLIAEDLNHRNGLIAGLSLCAGLIAASGKFFPGAFPEFLDPLMRNGVALGGMVAVLATLVTHFAAERRIRVSVKPQMENLPQFKEDIHAVAKDYQLGMDELGYLELACEEVYFYMAEEYKAMGYEGKINFSFHHADVGTIVEVSGGKRFESEADEISMREEFCPMALGGEQLNALGLILLGRVADAVNHVNIGRYTFISFTISEKP